MAYPKRFIIDTIRTAAFGAIGAAYAAVGAALASPARIYCIKNLTNENLSFSFDGVNEQIVVPPNGFELIDISTNRTNQENFFLAEGTFFYVRHRGAAPASGDIFIEVIRS